MDYFDKLIKDLSKGTDKKLLEYAKANIVRTFCPQMFYQDLEKINCRTDKGTLKPGFSCEKCWGCAIMEKKKIMDNKGELLNDKSKILKSSKTSRNKKSSARTK